MRSAGRSRVEWGQSNVALRIRPATGFRSLATLLHPMRPASRGMLPPPAVGSSTENVFKPPSTRSVRPFLVIFARQVCERSFVPIGVGTEVFFGSLCDVDASACLDRISVDSQHVQEPFAVGVGRKQRGKHCGARKPPAADAPTTRAGSKSEAVLSWTAVLGRSLLRAPRSVATVRSTVCRPSCSSQFPKDQLRCAAIFARDVRRGYGASLAPSGACEGRSGRAGGWAGASPSRASTRSPRAPSPRSLRPRLACCRGFASVRAFGR